MTSEAPFRAVVIQGAQAALFARSPKEFTTVKSAEDADRALGDPGNTQHCPLCNNFMGTFEFMRHAQSCIDANAPAWERHRDREPGYRDQKRFNNRTIVDLGSLRSQREARNG